MPFAGDDTAEVIQGTLAAIAIDVLANDAGGALGINPGITVLAPGASIGVATPGVVGPGAGVPVIFYRPPSTTGTATFRYTVANAAGTSNVGTVTVNVIANPAGPIPTAVNDPSTGAINVTSGQSVVVNVLANDSANGGTLDPASVTRRHGSDDGHHHGRTRQRDAITYTATTAGTARSSTRSRTSRSRERHRSSARLRPP